MKIKNCFELRKGTFHDETELRDVMETSERELQSATIRNKISYDGKDLNDLRDDFADAGRGEEWNDLWKDHCSSAWKDCASVFGGGKNAAVCAFGFWKAPWKHIRKLPRNIIRP